MDSALGWIGSIIEWLGKFFPRWMVLDVTMGGVKFVGTFVRKERMRVVPCAPGVNWYWPATTLLHTYPIARQTDNLPTQVFCTSDDRTIAVGGMLVYSVDDVAKLITTTDSPAKAIQDIALTAIHDVCCNASWEQLKDEQRKGTLDTKLRNAAQKMLRDYGVKVIKCMLTDLAPTRVLKIVQSVNQDSSL